MQLPIRVGALSSHTKINLDQNRATLINISKDKFSMVILGLTKTLHNVNDMVSFFTLLMRSVVGYLFVSEITFRNFLASDSRPPTDLALFLLRRPRLPLAAHGSEVHGAS